ncbi:hypothetical protein KI659_13035 [Litoribacter alkaliphilus]|uniref:Uncharacterized protein n=1 Tax=Litoribacter ruber TaxID=702568 RepID=A0AAP2CNE2_9BACT|nr:hypothetical protein [Litoribacter alkaliphilus]MBS9524937.1 hypothetical protein [Litoribacter alkaliphilus]
MKTKSIFYILILVVGGVVLWIAKDTFTQPGVQDLRGDYKEVAMYRNENNTGPIVRVYAVATSDTLWNEMEDYGNFMPHTKYGNTKVFFFNATENYPSELAPAAPYFPEEYQQACIGMYEKSAMGEVSLKRYPFRQR